MTKEELKEAIQNRMEEEHKAYIEKLNTTMFMSNDDLESFMRKGLISDGKIVAFREVLEMMDK